MRHLLIAIYREKKRKKITILFIFLGKIIPLDMHYLKLCIRDRITKGFLYKKS